MNIDKKNKIKHVTQRYTFTSKCKYMKDPLSYIQKYREKGESNNGKPHTKDHILEQFYLMVFMRPSGSSSEF